MSEKPEKTERGIVAVWSAGECVSFAFRIPKDGLVLGRDLFPSSDARLSRTHARVDAGDHQMVVTDLGSRNGTYVGGLSIGGRSAGVVALSTVRTAQTVWVVVDDIDNPVVDVVVKQIDDAIRSVAVLEMHASSIEATMLQFQRGEKVEAIVDGAKAGAHQRLMVGGVLRGEDIVPAVPEQVLNRRIRKKLKL